MMGESETRHWTKQEALDALQLLINGEHRLHVPPQATDADMVLGDVIDERDRLLAREAALVAALRAADWALLHCEQLDDQSIYQARLEIAAALVAAPGGVGGVGRGEEGEHEARATVAAARRCHLCAGDGARRGIAGTPGAR
jgi:hypothetical protein